MRSGDQYRERAAECMRAVEVMVETDRKIVLLELAQRWFRLAEQADLAGEKSLLAGCSPSRARH
jgi:hypothetical protein